MAMRRGQRRAALAGDIGFGDKRTSMRLRWSVATFRRSVADSAARSWTSAQSEGEGSTVSQFTREAVVKPRGYEMAVTSLDCWTFPVDAVDGPTPPDNVGPGNMTGDPRSDVRD